MPVDNHSDSLFMSGDTLDRIWSNFCKGNGIARKGLFPGNPVYGLSCPAYGCNRCDHRD